MRDAPEAQEQLDECVRVAADSHTTLVVYMGLSTLPSLVATLVSSGLSPDTPAVAVERGTTGEDLIWSLIWSLIRSLIRSLT